MSAVPPGAAPAASTEASSTEPASNEHHAAPAHEPTKRSALTRPQAAEREAVRAILQSVAREALATDDRAAFIRLLDSLDQRAVVVLGVFGRN